MIPVTWTHPPPGTSSCSRNSGSEYSLQRVSGSTTWPSESITSGRAFAVVMRAAYRDRSIHSSALELAFHQRVHLTHAHTLGRLSDSRRRRPRRHAVVGEPQPLRPLLLQRARARRRLLHRRRDGPLPGARRHRRRVQHRDRRCGALGLRVGAHAARSRHQRRPIRIDVVEPMRVLRFTVAPNDSPLTCDLTWRARTVVVEEPRQRNVTRDGIVTNEHTRLTQWGTWEGTVMVDGRQVDVDPTRVFGTRDRSWGMRGLSTPIPTQPTELRRRRVLALGAALLRRSVHAPRVARVPERQALGREHALRPAPRESRRARPGVSASTTPPR